SPFGALTSVPSLAGSPPRASSCSTRSRARASSGSRWRSSIPRRPAEFWQSSSAMPDNDRVRIEIAFDGQQVLSVLVPQQTADDLDRALAGDHDSAWSFEAEDGRYTVHLSRIVFVKRFARESRVGFGAVA